MAKTRREFLKLATALIPVLGGIAVSGGGEQSPSPPPEPLDLEPLMPKYGDMDWHISIENAFRAIQDNINELREAYY